MKTAISIPDPVFEAAEEVAQRLAMTRSELYTKAVQSFLDIHQHDGVTELLNDVYDNEAGGLDPVLARMQSASLTDESW